MKRTWTILGVKDVAASQRWYQTLFGQPLKPPAHDDFGQIVDDDGTVLLCLHQCRPGINVNAGPPVGLLANVPDPDPDRGLRDAALGLYTCRAQSCEVALGGDDACVAEEEAFAEAQTTYGACLGG